RLLGRPIVERLASRELIERYDYVMKHKGLLLAFLMFLIPGFPKDILCYILGLGHMNQRDFLLVSASGRLLGTVLLTMGGTFFRDEHYAALFTIVGVSLLIILLAMMYHDRLEHMLRRISGALRKERDQD
ncbi:MAG TPA: VTT domain-containing protein, partial [Sulfuricaulis sp.]|nr:VTT domain-containing protein [Sulfuricaulis sp.]